MGMDSNADLDFVIGQPYGRGPGACDRVLRRAEIPWCGSSNLGGGVMSRMAGHWLGLMGLSSASAADRLPNVVYVMADELGYFEPGFMGNPNIQTPNLDRMAARGMRLSTTCWRGRRSARRRGAAS